MDKKEKRKELRAERVTVLQDCDAETEKVMELLTNIEKRRGIFGSLIIWTSSK